MLGAGRLASRRTRMSVLGPAAAEFDDRDDAAAGGVSSAIHRRRRDRERSKGLTDRMSDRPLDIRTHSVLSYQVQIRMNCGCPFAFAFAFFVFAPI